MAELSYLLNGGTVSSPAVISVFSFDLLVVKEMKGNSIYCSSYPTKKFRKGCG